jgi:hypothetical protein
VKVRFVKFVEIDEWDEPASQAVLYNLVEVDEEEVKEVRAKGRVKSAKGKRRASAKKAVSSPGTHIQHIVMRIVCMYVMREQKGED